MAEADCSLLQTPWINPLVRDYLQGVARASAGIPAPPQLEAFAAHIRRKQNQYSPSHRASLVRVLEQQYQSLEPATAVVDNIKALAQPTTFTVTTGHQLNLFGGPAFMVYKMVATLVLARQLQQHYPQYRFVPLFWLASEDHDFEEINHLYTQNQKVTWVTDAAQAPVGRLVLHDMEVLQQQLQSLWGHSVQAQTLLDSFAQAYQNGRTLAQATLHWVHQWFGAEGLVQLQPDQPELKALFAPIMAQELRDNTLYESVNRTTQNWGDYPVQAHARQLNLFYIHNHQRLRLERQGEQIEALGGGPKGSLSEWLQRLDHSPEAFSPNALMRPLYQECILPNLAYVGGGAEVSYWLQLPSSFKAFHIPFPQLILRPSALVFTQRQWEQWHQKGLRLADWTLSKEQLQQRLVQQWSALPLDLTPLKKQWQNELSQLQRWASLTDPSFQGALGAFEKKHLNALDQLEKRLFKAEKRAHEQQWAKIQQLWNVAYPAGVLQERRQHFADFYLQGGTDWWQQLYHNIRPLDASLHALILPQ